MAFQITTKDLFTVAAVGFEAGNLLLTVHFHDSRHDDFHFMMQISHVVCQGANTEIMPFFRKSARLNGEISASKSHLRAKLWQNYCI